MRTRNAGAGRSTARAADRGDHFAANLTRLPSARSSDAKVGIARGQAVAMIQLRPCCRNRSDEAADSTTPSAAATTGADWLAGIEVDSLVHCRWPERIAAMASQRGARRTFRRPADVVGNGRCGCVSQTDVRRARQFVGSLFDFQPDGRFQRSRARPVAPGKGATLSATTVDPPSALEFRV